MNAIKNISLALAFLWLTFKCTSSKPLAFTTKEVYRSADLIITQIAPHSYKHTSFLQTNDFGNVPCNGLVVVKNDEAVIYDTPTKDESAAELILWVHQSLNSQIKAIIPTHFHDDCLGGLKAFHNQAIPSYANQRTIELAKHAGYEVPQHGFHDSLIVTIGGVKTVTKYFGEGHTVDNVVGYFPPDDILFGGCLVKELGASKGYLGDAKVLSWSATVANVKAGFPAVKIVVPGHGKHGTKKLLDYTIKLFKPR